MQASATSPSKFRIALSWLIALGTILGITAFFLWRRHNRGDEEAPADLARTVMFFVLGTLITLAGVLAYVITMASDCFTYRFDRQVWPGLKGKMYAVNIFVPLLFAVGLGLVCSALLSPVLFAAGLSSSMANFLPVMLGVAGIQILQLWILVWGPLERRIIAKRLRALGINDAQLSSGTFIGLSNPATPRLKRMGIIEEDVGVLWFSADQIIYWGDGGSFAITRDQLLEVERKAVAGSSTMLGGITHIILHVREPSGQVRQIRLHTEGLWTMGQKRQVMDQLAERVNQWRALAAGQLI